MKQSWDKEREGQIRSCWTVSIKANTDVFCILPHSAFFLCCCYSLGVLSLPVFKRNSPFHSACQTESSEDKKCFLAWNALWNVFENKVINDNCHQKLALSNAFFIVFKPKSPCCILKFQMVGWLCDRQASIFKYVQAHMKVHLCISLPIYKLYPHILFP